ncbi:MAG: phosphate ABC transporter substrate-binding protein PstS [Dokdonella sp.]
MPAVRFFAYALLGALSGLAAVQSPDGVAAEIRADVHGAGATFPAPVYAAWAAAYLRESGVGVAYDAVGSGAGIERIERGEVDFGATDAPLAADELAQRGLLQFPVVIGGVVPVVNISGIGPGRLRLSGEVIAGIYLGTIRKWNDTRIADLNPDLKLPGANITVVHRSDASGSSLLWTDYLARASTAWRTQVGSALRPAWPTGVGGDGNEGVASYVQRTRFAIGYVEYAFARAHRLSDAALRNRDGNYVQARRSSFRAAAAAADWNSNGDFRQMPTDLPGAASWPVTGASFVLLPTASAQAEHTRAARQFFDWALQHGEPIATNLDYEALPHAAIEAVRQVWRNAPAGKR